MLDAPYWIEWIISDYAPFVFNECEYFLSTPLRENRFLAERLFLSEYRNALDEGLYGETEINKLLEKYKLWFPGDEETLTKLTKDVEDIKVYIYESYTNSTRKKHFKQALVDTNEYINKLLLRKSTFNNFSAKSIAMLAKQNFLMGCSIYKSKNKPLLRRNWWLSQSDDIIQQAYSVAGDYILTDNDYRQLSRSNEWRSIWSGRRGSNLFGRPVVDFSISQRQLVMWSNLYDSVYKSSECPTDEIIEDNDALDGWMIKQRRKHDNSSNLNTIEGRLSDKMRSSEEIYIMCDEPDINKVYECNDITGRIRWNNIMKQVQKEGSVNYMGLKDSQTEFMRRIAERG